MKSLILIVGLLWCLSGTSQDATTFILVRHSEKANDGTRNPPLSEEGKLRSDRLNEMLSKADISAIYSTDFYRTKQTVEPLAKTKGIEIKTYGWKDPEALLSSIIETHKGGIVIISGHSNTTPTLANLLLGESAFENFDEKDYGNLLIVSAASLGQGQLLHLRF